MLNKEKEIQKAIDKYHELDKFWRGFSDATGIDYDSPLGDVIWKTFDLYSDTLQKLIGDEDEDLDWFIFDNNCGQNKLKKTINGKKKKIKTIKDLMKLIESREEIQTVEK